MKFLSYRYGWVDGSYILVWPHVFFPRIVVYAHSLLILVYFYRYDLCYTHLFCTLASFALRAEGLLSRSRLRGTHGTRAYTTLQAGPRPGSVARALGVQSRASWLVCHAGPWKPHSLVFFFPALLQLSSSLLRGSHDTAALAHQALPFVTAADGASVCVCVCVPCFLSPWETATNTIPRTDQFLGFCAGRRRKRCSELSKSNIAAAVQTRTTAAVQQQAPSIVR